MQDFQPCISLNFHLGHPHNWQFGANISLDPDCILIEAEVKVNVLSTQTQNNQHCSAGSQKYNISKNNTYNSNKNIQQIIQRKISKKSKTLLKI